MFTKVAVLLFDGGPLFESAVPIAVFGVRRPGCPEFDLKVVSETSSLASTGGMKLEAPHGLEALSDAEVVIVPTYVDDTFTPPSKPVVEALRSAHQCGATVVGLCLGAFVLAAAGLLDGRPATTHWNLAPQLARRYPSVEVREAELYIDDGDILTSAGSAAGLDLCLHLIRRGFGAATAGRVARALVVPPHRAGGQAQFIDRPVATVADTDPISRTLEWARANIHRTFTVDDLARRSTMSRRSFDRHFREATGTTATQWLLHQRLMRSQELLETTRLSIEQVARRSGFSSAVAFRPHFRSRFRVSPAAYRQTFATGA